MFRIVIVLICIAIMSRFIEETGRGNLEQGVESELDYSNIQQGSIGDNIRVLILSTSYRTKIHPAVQVSAPSGILISYDSKEERWESSEILNIEPDDERFDKSKIRLQTLNPDEEICIHNIERSYGTPSYSGIIELRTTAEGIAIINELPVEDYLCKVVPSEMPASYELEALKTQAVCARSYAYQQMQEYSYPEYEAHVDDSTQYQVYNNSKMQETSTKAVKETAGEEVWFKGNVATTYYYSTSCGKTTDLSAWGNKVNVENAYLQSVELKGKDGDFERNLPWYRWEANVPIETLSNLIGLNTGVDVGRIATIEVTKRGAGDIALQLVVSGDRGSVTIDTENKIRSALGGAGYTITKNDGTTTGSTNLLPSAFFTVEKKENLFIIKGGGFGHGIGMSQNGANEMAKAGKTYKEILQTFYQNVSIE